MFCQIFAAEDLFFEIILAVSATVKAIASPRTIPVTEPNVSIITSVTELPRSVKCCMYSSRVATRRQLLAE